MIKKQEVTLTLSINDARTVCTASNDTYELIFSDLDQSITINWIGKTNYKEFPLYENVVFPMIFKRVP